MKIKFFVGQSTNLDPLEDQVNEFLAKTDIVVEHVGHEANQSTTQVFVAYHEKDTEEA